MKIIFSLFFLSFFCFVSILPVHSGIYENALEKINSGERAAGEAVLEKLFKESASSEERINAGYDLVSLLAEEGRSTEALAVLESAGFQEHSFFYQFEKGWLLVSLNRIDEAVKAFARAKAFTASQSLLSQADFAIALAEAGRNRTDKALETIVSVYKGYPYLLSASSQLIGRWLMRKKDYDKASFFTGSSLQYDSHGYQAEADFAEISEKKKEYTPAWQAWRTLQEMDPDEKRYDKKLKKLAKKVKDGSDNLMFWQRMNWPVHTELRKIHGGADVKVALYADAEGKQAGITEFSFMANSDFDIVDDRLGPLMTGKKFTPWKIIYDTRENMLEIHDSLGSSTRSTYSNITITCRSAGAVILIKDPVFAGNPHGINRGDREAGGGLRIIHDESGIRLITVIDEESITCPITASLIRRSNELEFSKSAAVAVRTKIRYLAGHPRHNDGEAVMCDSSHCIEFSGLQTENMLATEAVRSTMRQVLVSTESGGLVPVSWIQACGGTVNICAEETENRTNPASPFSLYSSFITGPDGNILCIPESRLEYVDLNWTLVLDPSWIEARANRKSRIGALKTLVPLKRDEKGRVIELRAYGSKGYADFSGEKEISMLLAAGTLRSMLFSVRPVMKGGKPVYFIVRGSGTVSAGQGGDAPFCLRGAEGMAFKKNADYRTILEKYFPGTILSPSEPEKIQDTDEE